MSNLIRARPALAGFLRPRVSIPRRTSVALPLGLIAAILALALGLRLYNVSWDDNQHLHPDERHITLSANAVDLPSGFAEYFLTDRSPLNPYNQEVGSFVYGSLPLFLTKATAAALDLDDYDNLALVGRHLAAIFDVATVAIVFLIGRRLFGFAAGAIASVLYATAPLAVQHAHFFVVDSFLVFFVSFTLFFAVRIAQGGRTTDYVLAGIALGLGTACKLPALSLLPVLSLAATMQAWPALSSWLSGRKPEGVATQAFLTAAGGLALALLVVFFAFRVAQPYAFAQPDLAAPLSLVTFNQPWLDDQETQLDLLSGDAAFPPSVQWIGRDSYFYPLRQMIESGMGPVFGLLGWLAFAFASYRLVSSRDTRHLLLVAFVLVYFGFMGRQFSLYLRYFLPLYPILALLAGSALMELLGAISRAAPRPRFPGLAIGARAFVGLLLILAALPGLAYVSIYTKPVTRVEASEWIYDNVPSGSAIATEHWDDALPLRLPGAPDKQLTNLSLPLYELDTEEKISGLIDQLAEADYVVMSSNRLLNSIPKNPANYPITTRYYELLLAEELGFDLVRRFESSPSLLGVQFPDNEREESWSSYDHPPVLVFQKSADFSVERLESELGSGPFATDFHTPAEADGKTLVLTQQDLRLQSNGSSWFDVFSQNGFAASHPTVVWLLAIQVAALAITPVTLVLLRRLPDRGYLLAKPLGMLLLAYAVWLLVSLDVVHFTQGNIQLVLGGLLVLGGFFLFRWAAEIGAFVKAHWRLILFSEALFLLAFFAFWEVRLLNPDLWHPFRGGEKPMDLAYLTAVTRSTSLPPYDPWFAGGYINYYYLGQFFTATFLKLTTIPPEVGYNLAVPTFFAFTVASTFSVAYNLAAIGRGLMRRSPNLRKIPNWSLYAAGILGVVFVAVAGNLDGLGQLSERLSEVSSWQLNTNLPLVDTVANSTGGLWQVIVNGAELRDFDFWRSSRMLPPTISITEFPFFSFLFADLHAHMMALPFEVMVIGIGAALAMANRGERGSGHEWALIFILALAVGSLRWINSWDYPPYLLLALASLAIGERHLEGGARIASQRLLLKAGALTALSFLLFKPFLDTYLTPVAGIDSTPETTPPDQYLAHFGVLVAVIGVWLAYLGFRAWRVSVGGLSGLFRVPEDLPRVRRQFSRQLHFTVLVGVGGLLIMVMAGLVSLGHGLIAMLLPAQALVVYLAVRELRLQRPDGTLKLYLLMLVGLGLSLSIGVELVRISGDIQRMNTVFKFYLHTWIVFALVASFVVWYLAFMVWRPGGHSSLWARIGRGFCKSALLVLVLSILIYPVVATPVRLDDRFVALPATLDGSAFLEEAVYSDPKGEIVLAFDLEGIRWLRQNVQGVPTIVEGRSDLYRWGSRFSIHTGLPTVIGWDWHQIQQRGELSEQVHERVRDVDAFYANPDVPNALEFLRRYGVSYVIVGTLEKLYYPEIGLAKFDSGLKGALRVVYANAELTIFEVSSLNAARPVSP